MSFMRDSSTLHFFAGARGNQYVFGNGEYIETYHTLYQADILTLIELCGRFIASVEREAGYHDHRCAYEMVYELSKRFGVLNRLRRYDGVFQENGMWVDHPDPEVDRPVVETGVKQCPFCGELARVNDDDPEGYYVQCTGCYTSQGFRYSTDGEAVNAWNSRFFVKSIPDTV